ncbi:ribosome maturation factor RimM [Desulfuromonas sp. CSMB_57]|jgi:16S rRNA processing protein RimM|uniref:ribosome maturation factor RimM n=1 Tax=Desulfuromonas sp. CSMB_57 TaxID=2807629 RepID=UPI001CD4806E|nr:ribosome maturation factor RimM [Desulfuromonas sp. CSMB_57]
MATTGKALVALGKVVATHGLRGALKVQGTTPDFSALADVRQVLIQQAGEEPEIFRLRGASWQRGGLVVSLEGLDTVEAAATLVGASVLVAPEMMPQPAAGRYFWFQLQGLAAWDRQKGDLGRLEDIFVTAAHPVYVVRGRFGEVLIPAVSQFLVEVDFEQGRVLFDLPEGLVQEG